MVKPQTEFIALDKLGNYKPTVRWVANLSMRDWHMHVSGTFFMQILYHFREYCLVQELCLFLKPNPYWYAHSLCIMECCSWPSSFLPFVIVKMEAAKICMWILTCEVEITSMYSQHSNSLIDGIWKTYWSTRSSEESSLANFQEDETNWLIWNTKVTDKVLQHSFFSGNNQ